MTLREFLGWRQEDADRLRLEKKLEPNHRRNRARNKAARAARKRNRR